MSAIGGNDGSDQEGNGEQPPKESKHQRYRKVFLAKNLNNFTNFLEAKGGIQ